jgi:hypothetical protein
MKATETDACATRDVRPRSIDLTGTRNLIVTHPPTPWRSTTWWHLTIRAVGSFPSTADPASYLVAAEHLRRPAPSSAGCHTDMWNHTFLGPHVGSMRRHTEASHGKRGGTPRGLADREHRCLTHLAPTAMGRPAAGAWGCNGDSDGTTEVGPGGVKPVL